jgi:RNA recognition motif-containing protein
VKWQDLKDHFKQAGGHIVRADVMEEQTGRSKGCGIVEFSTAEEAAHALEIMNDSELDGWLMTMNCFALFGFISLSALFQHFRLCFCSLFFLLSSSSLSALSALVLLSFSSLFTSLSALFVQHSFGSLSSPSALYFSSSLQLSFSSFSSGSALFQLSFYFSFSSLSS